MAEEVTLRAVLEKQAEEKLAAFNAAAEKAERPTYEWYNGKEVVASPLEFEPRQITYQISDKNGFLGSLVVFPVGPSPKTIVMMRGNNEAMCFACNGKVKATGTFDFLALAAPERERRVRDGREKQQVLKLFCLSL